jgi:uncharacterized protein
LKDVARATSAAPTYFRPAQIESGTEIRYPLVDGGIFANNPAMCALVEAMTLKWRASTAMTRRNPTRTNPQPEGKQFEADDIVILSLGTGAVRMSFKYHEVKNYTKLSWVHPLIEFMMDGNADTVQHQLKALYGIKKGNDSFANQYVRIDPSLEDASHQMDDVCRENLRALAEAGRYAVERYDSKLRALAKLLIDQDERSLEIVDEES